MALTMTRTRTQSTLNKFVGLVANINGELEFLEGLLGQEHPEDVRARLLARQAQLQGQKAALFETIRQFDPGVEPGTIGALQAWRKAFRLGNAPLETEHSRYQRHLVRDPV